MVYGRHADASRKSEDMIMQALTKFAIAALFSALATGAAAGPLERINHEANKVRPHADATLVDGQYDCDDYAFAKLRALQAQKLDAGARVWMVSTPLEMHAVVLLSDGRVMDNLFQNLPTKRELEQFRRYVFVMPMSEDQ